ncbi:hypothetical protein MBT42_08230 [Streptomyces sp. MBT42]|uniref:hypothetical protein n=1 Tax=Streptomyces sp. MBT42 TaxID=1488373 RepID=UPI001E63C676|nr:hypothetical protein [Streptomyces sp. MBT42]MCD2463544.1 hypothetical protein [Streptomyces sp. MBT42]
MEFKLSKEDEAKVTLLARAWDVDGGGVVHRLLEYFESGAGGRDADAPVVSGGAVGVHARYDGHRIDAEFDPASESVTILAGPAEGRYKSPSGAATAVLQAYNPGVAPHRNGWSFWVVDASGERLQSIRHGQTSGDEV